jgi:hypothetical protein
MPHRSYMHIERALTNAPPLDAHYDSIVDEPSTELMFDFILVTHYVRSKSYIYIIYVWVGK